MDLRKVKVNGLTIVILLALILMGFAVIPAPAYAQSATAVVYHTNWGGYNGNNSVYMSSSASLCFPRELPNKSSHAYQCPNGILGTGRNGVALGVDSEIPTVSGDIHPEERYNSLDGQLYVCIISYAAGATNQTRVEENDGGDGGYDITGTSQFNLSMALTGLSRAQMNVQLCDSGNSGSGAVNLTFPHPETLGSTEEYPINQSLLSALGLVPVIGSFASAASLASTLTCYGASPAMTLYGIGSSLVGENLTVNPDSGNYSKFVNNTNCGVYTAYGQNVFATEMTTRISVNTSDFGLLGNLNVSAKDILGEFITPVGWHSLATGSQTNINIPFVPANTLSGSVTNYGKPLPDQQIIISQTYNGTTTDFYEHTNSSGDYRFFAEPGSSYTLEVDTGDGSIQSSNTVETSGYGSTSLNLNMDYPGTVTFHESGLSSGTTWSVTLNGVTDSTTSGTISFSEPFGTYSYSIGSISGYSISPQSGSIELNDFSYSKDITFTSVGPVTFHESGLPSGTSWEAYVGSYSGSGTGTSLTVTAPTGTYSYSIPNVDVKMSNGDTDVYSANPSGGTVSTGGSVSTTFSLSEVISPPSGGGGGGGGTGCVNGTTEILLANGTYTQAQNITIGTHVMTYNTTSHTYSSETVEDIFYSHHSRQYTVNGYLQASEYQPILTNHGYIEIRNLTKHDRIFNIFTGKYGKITDITVQNGNYTFYDFNIPPNHDFIAWEYVVYDLTIKP